MLDKEESAVVRWAVAPAAAIASYFFAPRVGVKEPSSELGVFFTTSATLLGTFFIALALLTVISPVANLRIRRIIGKITFGYLALGATAAVSGTVETWPSWLYPYFFAVTVGTGVATMLAITRVGIENSQTQTDEIHARLAQLLDSRGSGSGRGLAGELTALTGLRDNKALTEDEFKLAKAKLLN